MVKAVLMSNSSCGAVLECMSGVPHAWLPDPLERHPWPPKCLGSRLVGVVHQTVERDPKNIGEIFAPVYYFEKTGSGQRLECNPR